MSNINSPLVKRLRSNKNYHLFNVKSKIIASSSETQNNFENLVDQLCDQPKNFIEGDSENYIEEIFLSGFQLYVFDNDEKNVIDMVQNFEKIELNSDEEWLLSCSQRKSYKLYSNGHCYVVDKPKRDLVETSSKIYWRCEFYNDCRGRGISNGLRQPFKMTLNHSLNHPNRPEDKEKLISKQNLREISVSSNEPPRAVIREFHAGLSDECISLIGKKDSIRRQIIRTRNKEKGYYKNNPQSLSELEIPDELKTTFKGYKFYFGDSGKTDKNRIIFFTTEQNLKILGTYPDWYSDGTFDIAPNIFKQVYTLHVDIRGTILPMLYALLP
ncbi:unnamed protein product [Brachionus calyciflorus]|uniref:FLYWCH-type domain-containing protein n=1 Tax=Brachionus calyciflorus TaxID=104777 RepID=A0A814QZ88_9BILA|nr:unnamed protein product [Brachionus calyciflorus]